MWHQLLLSSRARCIFSPSPSLHISIRCRVTSCSRQEQRPESAGIEQQRAEREGLQCERAPPAAPRRLNTDEGGRLFYSAPWLRPTHQANEDPLMNDRTSLFASAPIHTEPFWSRFSWKFANTLMVYIWLTEEPIYYNFPSLSFFYIIIKPKAI